MDNQKRNFESTFYETQPVYIHAGFYRNNYGTIKAYDTKLAMYVVEVIKNNVKKEILCDIKDIREVKGFKFW